MADKTSISWCDCTYNPWIGCTQVSPGCAHCYAEAQQGISRKAKWGDGEPRYRVKDLNKPLKWNKQSAALGRHLRVFCASFADVLDDQVDPSWQADLWTLIEQTPHLEWLLLTKRIQNQSLFPRHWLDGRWPPHAWIGTSVENKKLARTRIPQLLKLPARVRFLSLEPLLGPVDLSPWIDRGIGWVIVGGESGPHARPMNPRWVADIRDQCAKAKVPFHFKQWGAYRYGEVIASPSGVTRLSGTVPMTGTTFTVFPPNDDQSRQLSVADLRPFFCEPGTVIGARVGNGDDAGHDKLDGRIHQEWPSDSEVAETRTTKRKP